MRIINKNGKSIKYSIDRFPDGEVQVNIMEPINHKEEYEVTMRITNAEDLFIVDQVMDILDRHGVLYTMNIPYLMGMRMDRVMDFNRPFTLKLVADVFNKHNPQSVWILETHSNRTFDLIDKAVDDEDFNIFKTVGDKQIVLPDDGAIKRFGNFCDAIKCTKTRSSNGITIKVENPDAITSNHLIIIDDLCDGGATFCKVYDELISINPNLIIDLYITHAVNAVGLLKVCDKFNHVYTTNSYKDWIETDKLTVFKIVNQNEI